MFLLSSCCIVFFWHCSSIKNSAHHKKKVESHAGHGFDRHTDSEPHSDGDGEFDEAIVPSDLNLIYAKDLRDIVNENLKPGVKFTMISGMLLCLHSCCQHCVDNVLQQTTFSTGSSLYCTLD